MAQNRTEKSPSIENLFTSLCELETSCSLCSEIYNAKINHALQHGKMILQKLQTNLTANFHLVKQQSNVVEKNIFSFILSLVELVKLYDDLQNAEEVNQHKIQLGKDKQDLFAILTEIITALKGSNLHLFKFM